MLMLFGHIFRIFKSKQIQHYADAVIIKLTDYVQIDFMHYPVLYVLVAQILFSVF